MADQLGGIIARIIARGDVMLTPEDVIMIVTLELRRPGLRAWLDAVRIWRRHNTPLARVRLSGAGGQQLEPRVCVHPSTRLVSWVNDKQVTTNTVLA